MPAKCTRLTSKREQIAYRCRPPELLTLSPAAALPRRSPRQLTLFGLLRAELVSDTLLWLRSNDSERDISACA